MTLNPTLVSIFVIGAAVGGVSGVLSSVLLSEETSATDRQDRTPRTESRSPLRLSALRAVEPPSGGLLAPANEQRSAAAESEHAAEAHGESAADVLARLEAAYLARLTTAQPEHASPVAESLVAESLVEGEVSPEPLEAQQLLALASPDLIEPDAHPGGDERGEAGAPPASATTNHVQITTNNTVVAPAFVTTQVFVDGSRPSDERADVPDGAFVSVVGPTLREGSATVVADSSASTDARGRGYVTRGSLVPAMGASTESVMPSQRTAPSARPRPGTPTSSHGRNPWAPIDMSRHHNPWGASRLR